MPQSSSTGPERAGQFWFRLRTLAGCLLLLFLVDNWHWELTQTPNRRDLPPRTAELRFETVDIEAAADSPFEVAGAWTVTGDDPRFGGISGLAIDGGELIAVSDNGSVIAFPMPAGSGAVPARIRDLPTGPLTPRFKAYRDAEAIVRDPRGRGWWISFENVNHLWLYDRRFDRALQRIRLGGLIVPYGNQGLEAGAVEGEDLLFFGEKGEVVLRVHGSAATASRLPRPIGPVSEAATLERGRILAIERRLTPLGFRNALVKLNRSAAGYVRGSSAELPVSRLDNMEALAIQRSGARTRVWLMSDDSFEPPYRTVLLALDMEEAWLRRP